MATGTLKKWGNSQGILIPKSYCEQLAIRPGDKIDLSLDGDKITLRPEKEFTFSALMRGYDGPPPQEYDWGKPAGKELW
jgi:AbrB family looped-hinge helix DNA binding protein